MAFVAFRAVDPGFASVPLVLPVSLSLPPSFYPGVLPSSGYLCQLTFTLWGGITKGIDLSRKIREDCETRWRGRAKRFTHTEL